MNGTSDRCLWQLPGRSLFGLNAANFFQAEMVGVILPVLNALLEERWLAVRRRPRHGGGRARDSAVPGSGRVADRPALKPALIFVAVSLLTGLCFVVFPLVPLAPWWVDTLLFISGAAQSLFVPLLGALALGLAGHKLLNLTMGANQAGITQATSRRRCWPWHWSPRSD